MYRHLLVFPDGREVFSGADCDAAIQSVTVTQSVNTGQELTLGSACAAMLRAELITPAGNLTVTAGQPITVYGVDDKNNRSQIGVFYPEEPLRPTRDTMELTAYDAVSRLDKDLSAWLAELDRWPYSVRELADMVCGECGLMLAQSELPNGEFPIPPFTASHVTGRQLMQWLGEIAGRFCRATADGNIEFAWYLPNEDAAITPSGEDGGVFYYQGQLEYEDYGTLPIEKVQIRQTPEDVGTVWPDETGQKNTYIIEGNPMLTAQAADTLQGVAQTLYEQLQSLSYTPCKVTIPASPQIQAGQIVTVTDIDGKSFSACVMKKASNGQQDTLECTGSYLRENTTATNNAFYQVTSGKVLNLRTDVDGLKVENKDTQGKLAAITLDLEGISNRVEQQDTTVEGLKGQISTLDQTAQSLSLELTAIRQNGADKVKTTQGYTFDDKGLHISRSDSDMANTLDHTGMYVRRGEEVMLQANNQGVVATDVTVRNYLSIGHARFEEYSNGSDFARTACFFV